MEFTWYVCRVIAAPVITFYDRNCFELVLFLSPFKPCRILGFFMFRKLPYTHVRFKSIPYHEGVGFVFYVYLKHGEIPSRYLKKYRHMPNCSLHLFKLLVNQKNERTKQ